MANRTLITGEQVACGTNSGVASTFGNATVVRLCNNGSTARLIAVVTAAGGTVVGSFTMPGNTVEFLEKKPTEAIFASDTSVLGSPVGFTN